MHTCLWWFDMQRVPYGRCIWRYLCRKIQLRVVIHSSNNNNDRSITVGLNYAVFSLATLIMDVDDACLMINSSAVASSPTPPPGSDRASKPLTSTSRVTKSNQTLTRGTRDTVSLEKIFGSANKRYNARLHTFQKKIFFTSNPAFLYGTE